MTAKVIQGWFLGGRPKLLPSFQPKIAPPPIQAKTAGPPAAVLARRPPGPPAPAFGAPPPGPPAPALAARPKAVQRHGAGGAFALEAGQLGLASGGGRPLPEAVRGKMEAAFGADFSHVRVHVGPQAERIGAIAFTIGSDIYFAPGRYQPATVQGRHLLGHELAHVVQQRAGRVRNPLGSGLAIVQDTALEAEADRLGRRAAASALPSGNIQMSASTNFHRASPQSAAGHAVMQRRAAARVPSVHGAGPLRGSRGGVVQRMEMELTNVGEGKRSGQIVGLMDEEIDLEQMTLDVKSVCRKVRHWATQNLHEVRVETGRDLFFYNKWAWTWAAKAPNESTVVYQLAHWDIEGEGPGDTVAMLMDFALAWKHMRDEENESSLDKYAHEYATQRTVTRRTQEYLEEKGRQVPLSEEELQQKFEKSKKFLTDAHVEANTPNVNERFPPGTELGELRRRHGYEIQAGPSSSTATLLWLLRRVGGITQREAKSVAHALASQYWGKGLKWVSRQYHTKFEVMIPLARHLKKFQEEQEII
ncbi:MAG TPA: DUF4157 domain-containing protein [Stellaceae bacterium]|nr:DUF4157 domain-containing protein [Stellaceae bacterium]